MTSAVRQTWKQVGLGGLNLIVSFVVLQLAAHAVPARIPLGIRGAIGAVPMLAAYIAGSRWIEKRRPSELDVRRLWPETPIGFATGFGLFTATMAILWIFSVYRPGGIGTGSRILYEFVFALGAGVLEEILFRGLLFRLSSKILGTWGALLFTAAFFGLAHAANPGASVVSSLAIALEAGILLGAAYAATERLWVPIGLHIGWNFTEGSVFGMAISGTDANPGLIRGYLSGSRIMTGGQFGPEASIVAVLVCLAAAIYFLRRIVELRRVEPPIWKKNVANKVFST